MKIISKKIVYDTLISRVPGIVPSIMNSWAIPALYNCGSYTNSETFFSYDSAVKRAHEYNISDSQLLYNAQFVNFDKNNLIEFTVGNYGLIPSDVIIPHDIAEIITDYTDIYVNLPVTEKFLNTLYNDEKKLYGEFFDLSWPINKDRDPHYEGRKIISGGTEIKILTYQTLNKWYSFFKKYYELINYYTQPRIYKTAIDFYNKEVKVKNEEAEAYYKSLDDTFISRGGEKMYDWISNNCIVQYQIPAKFSDEWNTTYLYYPEAIKWYYWFKEASKNFEYVYNLEDCASIKSDKFDCCDCTKFVKLGGHEFYNDLKKWVDSIDINPNFSTNSASVSIPISFTNTIDDLGEMTIFSSKWKEERDYHNTLSDDGYGTVIDRPHIKYFKCKQCGYEAEEKYFEENDGKCPNCQCFSHDFFDATLFETYMIGKGNNKKGYEYNKYYENVFKESDWICYTDYYISTYPEEFVINGVVDGRLVEINNYTYSPINGKVKYNPSEITEKIQINKIQNVCINGNTYEVIDGKYVEVCYSTNLIADLKYKKRAKLQVFKDGDIEYVILNGRKKYVETDPVDPSKEIVYLLKESDCYDEGCYVSEGKYIVYDNCLYLVENNAITIYDDETKISYSIIDGYFDINDNRFYVSGNSVVVQSEPIYNYESNTYSYAFKKLGEAELKLFNLDKIVINNEQTYATLYYSFSKYNCKIISGYTDSKVSLLRRKEITTDDLGNELPGYFKSIVDINGGGMQSKYNLPYDECTLDILYKVGEVSDLKPIGVSETKFIGNIITDIKFYYLDENKNIKIERHALNDDALEKIKECQTEFEQLDDETIINTLYCDITYHFGAVINKNGDDYKYDETLHGGVKYIDTVYVSKQVGTYYLNNDRQFTFSYYLLSNDVDTIYISDFNTSKIWDSSTYFEIEPMLYTSSGIYDEEKFESFVNNNGVILSPVFRNEYNLASSLPQNIEADIYIDRGINAAFEKHLKLQEIRTMEALENYGNSWFKINDY